MTQAASGIGKTLLNMNTKYNISENCKFLTLVLILIINFYPHLLHLVNFYLIVLSCSGRPNNFIYFIKY